MSIFAEVAENERINDRHPRYNEYIQFGARHWSCVIKDKRKAEKWTMASAVKLLLGGRLGDHAVVVLITHNTTQWQAGVQVVSDKGWKIAIHWHNLKIAAKTKYCVGRRGNHRFCYIFFVVFRWSNVAEWLELQWR